MEHSRIYIPPFSVPPGRTFGVDVGFEIPPERGVKIC